MAHQAFNPDAFSAAFSAEADAADPAFDGGAFLDSAFNATPTEALPHEPAFDGSAFLDTAFSATTNDAPVVPSANVTFTGAYPVPGLVAGVRYVSGAARPLAGTVRSAFQQADQAETGWNAVVQDAGHLPTGVAARYQDAAPINVDITQHGREALRVRDEGYVRFQDALRLAALNAHVEWQEGRKARHTRQVDYQDASRLPARFSSGRFQEAVSHRGRYDTGYQDALPVEVAAGFFFATASPRIFVRHSRYQDAAAMQVGVSEHPVVDPTDPGGPGDGEPVIVPVREVYVVLNNCFLRRVDGNVFLPTFDMSLSLDCDSWTWSFSASLPISAFDDVRPDSDGTPVEVETSINGVPYRWLVEERSRNRQFPETRFSIGGRGISARLASPGAPVLNFGNDEARTGQQLMADVLTLNGVPLDWDVEWGIDDWNQPPNLWTKQGTYAEALTEIAEAVGAYIQPTRATQGIRVLPRYPSLPRDWPEVTEYLQLPEDTITVESTAWEQKPRYNRVYVSGTTGGVVGRVTIAGTDGAMIAPDVSSPLIGDATAARMRGQRVLGETGHVATYGLRTAVGLRDEDNQPIGVVVPGRFIRYIENGVPKIGLSRAVKVDIDPVEVWQTVQIEVHEDVEIT